MTSKWKDWASLVYSWRQEHMRPFDCIFSWLEYRFDHHGQTCYDGTKRKRNKRLMNGVWRWADWWLASGWRHGSAEFGPLLHHDVLLSSKRLYSRIISWMIPLNWSIDCWWWLVGWSDWIGWFTSAERMRDIESNRAKLNGPITRNDDIVSTPLYDAMSQVVIVYLL